MAYYGTAANPLAEALSLLVSEPLPSRIEETLREVRQIDKLGEDDHTAVYEWATAHAGISWFTGLGILDAADLLVESAIGNDNIDLIPQESVALT